MTNEQMTIDESVKKKARAKKMMLWFGIVSLLMTFAGWTSAYIVSSTREDWLADFSIPNAFWISTGIILLSSLTYWMALRAVQKGKAKAGSRWLWLTLVLGGLFVVSQVSGFNQMIAYGYYFTGPTSSITLSYVYLIAMVHLVHVAVGLITLIVVLVQHLRGKYSPGNTLGMELGITFWHFLDALWIYLVLFFYLYQ